MTGDWYMSTSGRAYALARKRAFTELRQTHPIEFDILYLAMQQEVKAEEGVEKLDAKMKRRAHSRALRRLGAQFRGTYNGMVDKHWVATKNEARQRWLDSLDK